MMDERNRLAKYIQQLKEHTLLREGMEALLEEVEQLHSWSLHHTLFLSWLLQIFEVSSHYILNIL